MTKSFEPELGQDIFGDEYQELDASDLVKTALVYLSEQFDASRIYNPFEISGYPFDANNIHIEAYKYEGEQPYCFKWRDVEISWYKHLKRSMSMNRVVSPTEVHEMVIEVMDAILRFEPEYLK
jgi:hypothetical protein